MPLKRLPSSTLFVLLVTLALFFCGRSADGQTLPTGWADQDIGSVPTAGSASFANGVFTVTGSGSSYTNGTADAFHFAYQPLSGDGTIVARVVSVSNATYTQAGIMIRETLTAGATRMVVYNSASVIYDAYRTSTGGSASFAQDQTESLPYWLKLVRSGSTFTAYISIDGVNWVQAGSSETISMAQSVYVGLGVDSTGFSSAFTATFDNVSINSTATPAPVITGVSATTGSVGTQVTISGSGFGTTQGSSHVVLNGAAATVNSWSASSINITIPSGATSGPLAVSVAPSMNDSNPVVFTVTAQPLPSGWLDQDIGVVKVAGSAGYSNGIFTVTGNGSSFLNGATDAFHFAYVPISGNATIVARVVSTSNSNAQAGIMIRETLNSGATNMVALNTQSEIWDGFRTTTGGNNSNSEDKGQVLPCWLELVRSGNAFTAYSSFDGVDWVQEGSTETINMAQNAYIGLAVNSFGSSSAYSATFDNVSISTAASAAPQIMNVSASTGAVGSQIVISGSGFGASQGNSQVFLNDVTAAVGVWSNTSITITVPGTTSGYLVVSVAPSMNDSNPIDFTVTSQPLPQGWLDLDVGQVGVDGTASYADGVFTVTGSGTNLFGTTEAMHFAYQQLSGDGTIVARLQSLSSTFAEAGVMIRESLDAQAKSIAVVNLTGLAYQLFRAIPAIQDGTQTRGPSESVPYWMKIVRTGNTFYTYASPDGNSWTSVGGPVAIDMAHTVYIGLLESSASTSSTYTAGFDNVSISTAGNVAPIITGLSATTGPVGTQVVISGSGFGASQGNNQALLNDVPVTINSWAATSITATVPTGATSGYIVVSLAPSMTSSNGVYFAVTSQPLPGGWFDQDIGSVGATGRATYANGVFTVTGAGGGITGQADSFHFVYQPLSTNGTIVARVVSLPTGNEAGVTMRETLDQSSAETFSYFLSSTSGLAEFMNSRSVEDSAAVGTNSATVTAPYWVQVVRNANQFSAFVSADGLTWFQLGTTQTISTTETIYVGLAVASRTPGTLATATFDNVSVGSGSTLANPTISTISPNTGAPAQSVTISGSGFGATQSGGTVTFNTSAATVTSWSDSQIVAVVPASVTTGPVAVTASSITTQGPTFTVAFPVNVTDSLGNQTAYNSVPAGSEWVLATSQGSGCSTCTTRGNVNNQYDGNGNQIGTTDPNGNSTLYGYDSSSDVTEQVSVLNTTAVTTTYTYNSFGEVLTMTDPLGNVTTNTYDAHGNLLTVTTPAPNSSTAASKTQFAYNALGELTQITDPLTRITKITYTPQGYIATITDPQSNVTTYGYDSRGNRTSVKDAMNNTTTFAYDAGNRLTGITYPDQSTASFTYDYRGRRITATDQNSKTTTYAYDQTDRLTSVTDAATNVTSYTYDTENNLLSITDANQHTTNFAYDAFGRVKQTTFPSNYSESYAYDANNNLTSKTDRNGHTIQYVYDALNRLTQKSYPDSTSAEYTYDLVGKILQVNDPTGTYAFAYDNMGRLIGTTTTYSFLPNTPFTNSYSYDADSNRTGFTAPDASTNTYTYDTLNRLSTLANSWAGSFGFSYDALSRRTQMTRPNGIASNYSYDKLSHLLSVLHQAGTSTIDGEGYTLDPAGSRTAKQDYLAGVTSNYTYDKIYELTQVTQGTNTTESYSYDPVGNRLSSLGVASYSYNISNELTSSSQGSYTYDANGNTLTDASGKSYAWDFENRLTQVTMPSSGGTVSFKYDPFGRRIEKISPTATSIFVYDGDNLVETANASGGEVASYAQGQNIDEPLAESIGGATYNYEQDGLGSVTSLTNSTAALSLSYTYDSFGNQTASSGSLTNFFRYTGREFDKETNQYYYRARYYDSTIGRFLSEDSVAFREGVNFYRYVRNNPTRFTDPSGHGVVDCLRCIYYLNKCNSTGQKCKQDLDKKYKTDEQLLTATGCGNPDDAYFKVCWAGNPDCQKKTKYCGECSLWPVTVGGTVNP